MRLFPCSSIAGILAGLALVVSTGSCREQATQNPDDDPAIARLEAATSEVRVRRHDELIWRAAEAGMALNNYDSLRTGAASTASVRFNDQTVLSLEPDTMVVIIDHERKPAVETSVVAMPVGKIAGRVESHPQKGIELQVRTPAGWVSSRRKAGELAEAARFAAAVSEEGALHVRSESGSLVVQSGANEKLIPNGAAFEAPGPKGYSGRVAIEEEPSRLKDRYRAPPQAKVKSRDHFEIAWPKNGEVVADAKVTIRGTLEGRLKVFLNGVEIKAGATGAFAAPYTLSPGANVLTFTIVGPSEDTIRYETREVMLR